MQLVYPATQQQINKLIAKHSTEYAVITETAEMYETVTRPYMLDQLKQESQIKWIRDIFTGAAEPEKVLFRSDEFLLVRKPEWSEDDRININAIVMFDLNGVMANGGFDVQSTPLCIRELRSSHVELIRRAMNQSLDLFSSHFTIPSTSLQCYFHYHPSYYQLHFHITHVSLSGSTTSTINRAVDVEDVLWRLQNDNTGFQVTDTLFSSIRFCTCLCSCVFHPVFRIRCFSC